MQALQKRGGKLVVIDPRRTETAVLADEVGERAVLDLDDAESRPVHAVGPGFAVGVQWHPEYDWERDVVSRRIFEVFGVAVRARLEGARAGAAIAAG